MGWASGSEIAESVWLEVVDYIPADKRRGVAKRLVNVFEAYDCDTMSEAEELWKAARARKGNAE